METKVESFTRKAANFKFLSSHFFLKKKIQKLAIQNSSDKTRDVARNNSNI